MLVGDLVVTLGEWDPAGDPAGVGNFVYIVYGLFQWGPRDVPPLFRVTSIYFWSNLYLERIDKRVHHKNSRFQLPACLNGDAVAQGLPARRMSD